MTRCTMNNKDLYLHKFIKGISYDDNGVSQAPTPEPYHFVRRPCECQRTFSEAKKAVLFCLGQTMASQCTKNFLSDEFPCSNVLMTVSGDMGKKGKITIPLCAAVLRMSTYFFGSQKSSTLCLGQTMASQCTKNLLSDEFPCSNVLMTVFESLN
ncbi:hypothetical protein BD770DRAFT_408239 [Pilaira anomala]|nr:hypothetical protein BD770DRAFT_408239 [Pilaira anomala]